MMETYDYDYYHASHAAAAQAAMGAERHVLAERYKTKMCRNYLQHGECPYEVRCMFAHGDHELRTCEMNVRDGLTTEEAIKAFQRMWHARRHMRNSAHHAYHDESHYTIPEYIGAPPRATSESSYTHNPYGYAVVRPSVALSEEEYSSEDECAPFTTKVDPSAAMEP